MKYANLLDEKGLNIATFVFPLAWDEEKLGDPSLVWLDIECEKVPAPKTWGYSTRTKTIMVGLAYWIPNEVILEVVTGEEAQIMEYVSRKISGKTVIYSATRSYDRLVLEGHWTYARRGPATLSGEWAHIDLAAAKEWENLRYLKSVYRSETDAGFYPYSRSFDVASKDVPEVWRSEIDVVVLHNVRDLLEMVLLDSRCPSFDLLANVLEDEPKFALQALNDYYVKY